MLPWKKILKCSPWQTSILTAGQPEGLLQDAELTPSYVSAEARLRGRWGDALPIAGWTSPLVVHGGDSGRGVLAMVGPLPFDGSGDVNGGGAGYVTNGDMSLTNRKQIKKTTNLPKNMHLPHTTLLPAGNVLKHRLWDPARGKTRSNTGAPFHSSLIIGEDLCENVKENLQMPPPYIWSHIEGIKPSIFHILPTY